MRRIHLSIAIVISPLFLITVNHTFAQPFIMGQKSDRQPFGSNTIQAIKYGIRRSK